MAVKIQPSIIDKRFLAGDFKNACVLNKNAEFKIFNKRQNNKLNTSPLKKTRTLQRRRTY